MKRYFISETEEEVVFGDVIQVDLTKKGKNGTHVFKGEVKFTPEAIPMLIDMEIIEECEEEEVEDTNDSPLIDFSDDVNDGCPFEYMIQLLEEMRDMLGTICNKHKKQ